jgi:hypothetical protein
MDYGLQSPVAILLARNRIVIRYCVTMQHTFDIE